eukprot:1139861-Pelagomonas_calceolata.AAC.4
MKAAIQPGSAIRRSISLPVSSLPPQRHLLRLPCCLSHPGPNHFTSNRLCHQKRPVHKERRLAQFNPHDKHSAMLVIDGAGHAQQRVSRPCKWTEESRGPVCLLR